MRVYLQGILFGRANSYASRRGYANDKERAALVDGWLAGYASGKRKDARIDELLAKTNTVGELLPAKEWESK